MTLTLEIEMGLLESLLGVRGVMMDDEELRVEEAIVVAGENYYDLM